MQSQLPIASPHLTIRGLSSQLAQEVEVEIARVYSDKRLVDKMPVKLELTEAARLLNAVVLHAIEKPKETLRFDGAELGVAIAYLNLKISLPHGTLCDMVDNLSLPGSARISLRDVNRLVELPKGWLGCRNSGLQAKVTIGILRRRPDMREALASGKIFEDLAECGSLLQFRKKYCPTLCKDSPKARFLRIVGQLQNLVEELA